MATTPALQNRAARRAGIAFIALLIVSVMLMAFSSNPAVRDAQNGIGFAFTDYDAVWKTMDGELGAYVRGDITKANLVVMDKIWDNGFRQTTTSNKPIVTPADLVNLKIRVPPAPLWTSMYKGFGAAPTDPCVTSVSSTTDRSAAASHGQCMNGKLNAP